MKPYASALFLPADHHLPKDSTVSQNTIEEQICACVAPPDLEGKSLLLRIPHTLVTGHRGIIDIDQEASALLASFHSTRR